MGADPIGIRAAETRSRPAPKRNDPSPSLEFTSRMRLALILGCFVLVGSLMYSWNISLAQGVSVSNVQQKSNAHVKTRLDKSEAPPANPGVPADPPTRSDEPIVVEVDPVGNDTTVTEAPVPEDGQAGKDNSDGPTTEPPAVESPKIEPGPAIPADEAEIMKSRHGNSFGGINNIGHPGGVRAAAKEEGIAFATTSIPVSNVPTAIPSVNRPNLVNLWGHYVHDEHRSPYASYLYKSKTQQELEAEQERFLDKMKKVREEWGAWDFKDPDPSKQRERPNFQVPYKDIPASSFPNTSWQADEAYNKAFLKEAKALVKRMQHAIYAEYGWPVKDDMTEEAKENHETAWKIHILDEVKSAKNSKMWSQILPEGTEKSPFGVGRLTKSAMDGLVRKLLHAMMTHDEFYAVLAGHSAAAGHGNDFQQNRIITFQTIMEPVFDKLGMRLISRNMAMGGVGTAHFALAGKDLYGEADIMEWDSGMTESGLTSDQFNKQAILTGERVPVIITDRPYEIMQETNGTAYMGEYVNRGKIFPETTLENFKTIPYAAQWANEKREKYNAVCWEPRTDFEPPKQDQHPGSQVGWHPGNRVHTWEGRRLALVVLHGLSIALDTWETGVEKDGVPLAEKYWHVGGEYERIREKLLTNIANPQPDNDDAQSACEKVYAQYPRVCRVPMRGFGMWTPRVSDQADFLKLVHPAPNGYKPFINGTKAYNGFDILPYNQKVADDQIDVHAIAIATTDPAPDLDHSWIVDDSKSSEASNRRWLQGISELAMKAGAASEYFDSPVIAKSVTASQLRRRNLVEDEIVPGRGWGIDSWCLACNTFCDGSAQSECTRVSTGKQSKCLLSGVNDQHHGVQGSSLSGWLVFTLPKVKEGIILARMEWWCNMDGRATMTSGWTEVNNGKTTDTTPWNATSESRNLIRQELPSRQQDRRFLKNSFDDVVPKDLKMDIAINGKITHTMEYEEFKSYKNEPSKNCAAWPLLDDPSMAEKAGDAEDVEVAIRFQSKEKPTQAFCLSHIYYA